MLYTAGGDQHALFQEGGQLLRSLNRREPVLLTTCAEEHQCVDFLVQLGEGHSQQLSLYWDDTERQQRQRDREPEKGTWRGIVRKST
jgi:hypothetical protein